MADLSGAKLVGVKLISADLTHADLTKADLTGANLSGANFTGANLTEAKVTSVLWDQARMRGRYQGVRGVDSCYGNALFKRAAGDQDYLDTLEGHWAGTWRKVLFWAWGLIDYSRNLGRVLLIALLAMLVYGVAYWWWPDMLNYPACKAPATAECNPGFTAF